MVYIYIIYMEYIYRIYIIYIIEFPPFLSKSKCTGTAQGLRGVRYKGFIGRVKYRLHDVGCNM